MTTVRVASLSARAPPPPRPDRDRRGDRAAGAAPARPLRLLLVDDDPAVRTRLAAALSGCGHAVHAAADAAAAEAERSVGTAAARSTCWSATWCCRG
jgi:hypothetical protein